MTKALAVLAVIALLVIALFGSSIFQVYQGGTGNSTLMAHALLLGEGSSAISSVTLGAHQVAVGASSADPSAKTVPDCQDTGGNHLNFTQSTDAFSCGTSSSGGGGGSSGGPLYNTFQCLLSDPSGSNHTSISCSSAFNVTSGETYLMFCAGFTNDGGTITISGTDSLSGATWTLDHSYYSSTAGGRLAVMRHTFASSGSTTFTCNYSAGTPFTTLTVVGATGINSVDTTADINSGAGVANMTSGLFTTATAMEYVFLYAFSGGTGNSCTLAKFSGGTDINPNTSLGNYLGGKMLSAAGTYRLYASGCNATFGNFAIAYK